MINREKISSHLITGFIFLQCAWPITAIFILSKYTNDVDKCDINIKLWTIVFTSTLSVLQTTTVLERLLMNTRYSTILWLGSILCLWISACILYANANKTHICEKVVPDLYNFMVAFVLAVPIVIIIFLIGIIMCSIIYDIYHYIIYNYTQYRHIPLDELEESV